MSIDKDANTMDVQPHSHLPEVTHRFLGDRNPRLMNPTTGAPGSADSPPQDLAPDVKRGFNRLPWHQRASPSATRYEKFLLRLIELLRLGAI